MSSHLGSLEDKGALVTGASRGIGRAAAVALAKAGAVVARVGVFHGRRTMAGQGQGGKG